MSAMAGTLTREDHVMHYSMKDRESFTISVDAPEGFMTLAFWDQSTDASNVMVIPRDQFDRAIQAYLGV